jgi:hypothetical protein
MASAGKMSAQKRLGLPAPSAQPLEVLPTLPLSGLAHALMTAAHKLLLVTLVVAKSLRRNVDERSTPATVTATVTATATATAFCGYRGIAGPGPPGFQRLG